MGCLLFGLVLGGNLAWVFVSLRRDGYWREFNARRRGSNPPPPGRSFDRGGICPNLEPPLRLLREPLDEGPTQRGNGGGGPTTPKPLIKPRPQGGTPNPPPSEP